MIKLNPDILNRVSGMYLTKMLTGVKDRYHKVLSSQPLLPHPFKEESFVTLFEKNDGTLDDRLVSDLLTATFEQLTASYPDIDAYFKTCQLVHYSHFEINKELDKEGKKKSNHERERFRKNYVSRFNNDWISNIVSDKSHQNYFKNDNKFKKLIDDISGEMKKLNDSIEQIVNYDEIDADFRHHLLNKMGVEVCPYCNRQFITHFDNDKKLRTTSDLDHFYPKSKFMLFSLSLYNFIPSCQICNSRYKLDKGIEILYPYKRGFEDDAYFHMKLTSNSTIDSITGDNALFDIELIVSGSSEGSELISNNVELFKLENIYKSHKDYVRELLYKQKKYADSYKADLMVMLNELDLSESEMNLFQYGFTLEEDDFGKRPLSKLAYDIIHQEGKD